MDETPKATEYVDAYDDWLKLKEVQETAITLLDQLNPARGQNEEALHEVGVSLAAVDMFLEVSCF